MALAERALNPFVEIFQTALDSLSDRIRPPRPVITKLWSYLVKRIANNTNQGALVE